MSAPYHGRLAPLAVPAECAAQAARWKLLGQAPWLVLGVPAYRLRLWAGNGFDPDDFLRWPFVLAMDFEREPDGRGLAERLVADMRRAGRCSLAQAEQWLAKLYQAFTLVKAQDRISAEHDGQTEIRFCHNGVPVLSVQDADFARLFFGLWLSAGATQPALRAALMGAATA